MELGAEGSKDFLRIMRLAGIPAGEKDVTITQEGHEVKTKKVIIRWER